MPTPLHRPVRVLLLLLVPVIAGPLAAQTAAPNRLTIASYNVENMFDVFDDPYTGDEATEVKPREEIHAIAEALRAINPDVAVFCEVENEGVLRAMALEMLDGMGYHHMTHGRTNSDRGINLGILSRLPIESVTSYRFQDLRLDGREQVWRFARDLLHVRLTVDVRRAVDVFVVHFKSRRDSPLDPNSNAWRMAEARAAHRIIGRIMADNPDGWVIMAGDFNDTPETPVMQLLAGKGEPSGLLVDMHASLPAEHRITYLREPYRSTIDYILASPALAKRLVPKSAQVLRDEKLLTGSDHAPVYATFDTTP